MNVARDWHLESRFSSLTAAFPIPIDISRALHQSTGKPVARGCRMLEAASLPRAGAIAIALFLVSAPCLRSQTPPSASVLTGVVRAVTGEPLGDVDVSLLGEPGSTRTDSAGRFALRDVPVGNHTVLFRRIGFASLDYRWPARGTTTPPI